MFAGCKEIIKRALETRSSLQDGFSVASSTGEGTTATFTLENPKMERQEI